ncbi:MAG: hypothetical protein J6R77_03980 [Clostridia bacterium]|nr:hypothetical protein [Clostridia bacterium]
MKTFWKVLIVLVAIAAAGTAAYLWLRAKRERCICDEDCLCEVDCCCEDDCDLTEDFAE